eukprot:6175611-Pleurochrysis_carterae.AAC.2
MADQRQREQLLSRSFARKMFMKYMSTAVCVVREGTYVSLAACAMPSYSGVSLQKLLQSALREEVVLVGLPLLEEVLDHSAPKTQAVVL